MIKLKLSFSDGIPIEEFDYHLVAFLMEFIQEGKEILFPKRRVQPKVF